MTRAVFIPKTGSEYPTVAKMFEGRGWTVVHEPGCHKDGDLADLLCLTGGCDVSPHLYGEENISSFCDPKRDEIEQEIYDYCKDQMPMVGICRGGQFLNVMNGGKMIQHIPPVWMGRSPVSGNIMVHEIGECPVDPKGCGDHIGCQGQCYVEHTVLVDHHQGMVPAEGGLITHQSEGGLIPYNVWYPDTKSLCFQPHPEWGHQPTEDLFFQLIEEYIHG